MVKRIYTIGHSTHTAAFFLQLLQAHGIDCVVDVRSIAASRFNPQYNKQSLSGFLQENGIQYIHFAEAFGARQTDPSLLTDGKVDFEKVRAGKAFRDGIGRLEQGIEKQYTIALMCAESDPMHCHRFSMITPGLKEHGFGILHILKDGTALPNPELEEQLLKKYEKQLQQQDMFSQAWSADQKLEAVYRLHNRDVGYSAK